MSIDPASDFSALPTNSLASAILSDFAVPQRSKSPFEPLFEDRLAASSSLKEPGENRSFLSFYPS